MIDLTYTSSEEEEEEGARLEGFVVSDSEVEYLSDSGDDDEIIAKQIHTVANMGTSFVAGQRRSTRVSKPPDRFVHPDEKEVHKEFIGQVLTTDSEEELSAGSDWEAGDEMGHESASDDETDDEPVDEPEVEM